MAKILLSKFLTDQDKEPMKATVEPVAGDDDKVKITPWSEQAGCQCSKALVVPKAAVDGVEATEDVHHCCGKTLKVVGVHFKASTPMPLHEVFKQMQSAHPVTMSCDRRPDKCSADNPYWECVNNSCNCKSSCDPTLFPRLQHLHGGDFAPGQFAPPHAPHFPGGHGPPGLRVHSCNPRPDKCTSPYAPYWNCTAAGCGCAPHCGQYMPSLPRDSRYDY